MPNTAPLAPLLPIEVIERIIDFIYELIYDNAVQAQDLHCIWRACALTCRSMVPRSQYWLFRNIFIWKTSQAENLTQLLRSGIQCSEHTRVLSLATARVLTAESGLRITWISWIPQLLAPRMASLEVLHLQGDVFSRSHPTFSMALSTFKSIRTLLLDDIQFTTFGHLSRLISAFPQLTHLALHHVSWKKSASRTPASMLQRPTTTCRRKLQIRHLDIVDSGAACQDRKLSELNRWIIKAGYHTKLRTLSIGAHQDDLIVSVLQFASKVRSIFLMLNGDDPIFGFEHCICLRILHIYASNHKIPARAVKSIINSPSSRNIERITIYMKIEEEGGKKPEIEPDMDNLDRALADQGSKDLRMVLCLLGSDSAIVAMSWRRDLPMLLPKFHAMGRLIVEHDDTCYGPFGRWQDWRDGF